jgi:hypothetical protein
MPPDPRDMELVETATSAIAGLILAHERVDHPAIQAQVLRLLGAIAKFNAARVERLDDAALRRAVSRLK